MSDVNDIRNIVMIATLVVIIALVSAQVGLAAMDVLAARRWKPKYCCHRAAVALVPIYIFAMWLVSSWKKFHWMM